MICHWQEEGSDGLVISQIRPECGSLKVGNHYIKICSEKLVERPKLVDSGSQPMFKHGHICLYFLSVLNLSI